MSDQPVRQWAKVTLLDGRVFLAGVDMRDFRAYDLNYKRLNWPQGTEAPFLVQNFIFAHALWREGEITDMSPEQITDQIATIVEENVEPVRPTGGAPGPDSSSRSPSQPTPPPPTGGTSPRKS